MSIKEIKQKGIKIELDKERTLLFDLNAFAEIEENYESFDEAINKLQKGSIKALRALLWAGLVHEDETLTEKEVGALIDMESMQTVAATLTAALGQNMPQQEPTGENSKGKK